MHLIVATICFRQTTLNPGCIVYVKFAASREKTALREIRRISEFLCSKDSLRRFADGLRHSNYIYTCKGMKV